VVHAEVICRVAEAALRLGLTPVDVNFSPITGPEGNIEYLLYLSNAEALVGDFQGRVERVVAESHDSLQPIWR
jgi:23S rRNA (cytidine1920-2'-O)/16S rRNA (cytidine1409-2'-O)-methyltransferase